MALTWRADRRSTGSQRSRVETRDGGGGKRETETERLPHEEEQHSERARDKRPFSSQGTKEIPYFYRFLGDGRKFCTISFSLA